VVTGELVVLGSAGSYPTRGNPGSGYVVTLGGATIVLDLGPGSFGALVDLVPIHAVDAVVVTHRHADHAADLLAWYHAARHGLAPRSAVPLFAPPDVLERVGAFLGKDAGELAVVFDQRAVDRGASVLGARLEFAVASHSVPAVSVRVEARGSVVVYSGDTAPNDRLAGLAVGADLLLCEATALRGPVPGHCGADEAGTIARDGEVGHLVLTHLREDVDAAEAIAAASEAFDGPVAVAEPGLRLPI
jgi:ribonuclease BN (tRNA processing enzyme)